MPNILYELNEISVAVRLIMAIACGGLMGFERTRKRRPAGLRTYMLVSMGACLVMLSGIYLYEMMGQNFDPARMASQVVNGIGFLGAGTIMITRYRRIKGLTTAAGLWASACMGLAVGAGFYLGAVLSFVFALLIMAFIDNIEHRYFARAKSMNVFFIMADLKSLHKFTRDMVARGVRVKDLETSRLDDEDGIGGYCSLHFPTQTEHAKILCEFAQIEGVIFIEELED